MSNRNKTTRTIVRSMHILAALMIGFLVYSPARDNEAFVLLVQAVVIPGAALTGVWMWQQARVRRLYGSLVGGPRGVAAGRGSKGRGAEPPDGDDS